MAQVSSATDPRGAALLEAQQKADQLFRAIEEQGLLGTKVDVVAVNDLVPADNLA